MKTVGVIIFCLLRLNMLAQYQKGDNAILIGHNSINILKELKILLIDNNYSIKSIDADIGLIETEYKHWEKANTRLVILYNDSIVVFKGWSNNGIIVTGYSGGIGLSSSTGEYRNEFRQSKFTVMAHGFNEMERIASLLWAKYQKEFKVFKD